MTMVNELYAAAQRLGLDDERTLQDCLLLVSGILKQNCNEKRLLEEKLDSWVLILRGLTLDESSGK